MRRDLESKFTRDRGSLPATRTEDKVAATLVFVLLQQLSTEGPSRLTPSILDILARPVDGGITHLTQQRSESPSERRGATTRLPSDRAVITDCESPSSRKSCTA
jgi:hypothetical protein